MATDWSQFTPVEQETIDWSQFTPVEGKAAEKKPPVNWDEFQPVAAAPDAQVSGETPTYGSALKAQLTEFPVRTMAGAVENLGDVIAPPEQDPSIREAFLKIPQRGIGVGGLGLAEAIGTGLRQSATRYLIPESLRAIGQDLTRQGAMVGAEANAYLKQETPQDLNMLQRASISAISSAAQMAPYLVGNRLGATGPLLRNTALGQFGASSGLEEYTQAKAGGAEPYQAQRAMELNALAEIGGEKLGLDTLMKGGPGYFKKFALQDIGGEIGTTIAQSLGEKAIYNPKKWSSAGEIGSDIVETALGAAMGAGAMKGLDVGLNLVAPGEAKAKKELDRILYENKQAEEDFKAIVERHGLGDTPATPPPPAHALTPAEEELAAIQEKQLAGGLANVPAHPDAPYFGPTLNQALAPEPAPVAPDQGWVSKEVQEGREKRREMFPPSEVKPENWQITIATTDQRVVGLTPAQVGAPPPGAVYAIRAPGQEENFPTQQYTLLAQDLTDWLQKYAPDTGLILNLNQFNKIQGSSTYGLHQPTFYEDGRGKKHLYHIITPRELASIASYGTADAKTVGAVLSGSAHEFGHLVRQSALRRSLAQTMGAYWSYEINKALAQDTMTPELWAKFAAEAPLEHALAAQWKDYQTRILTGTMTSSEFIETWAGARKIGESIARNLPENRDLYEWERNQLRVHGLPATGASAAELLVGKRGVNGEFSKDQMADLLELTNFNEYMAEQFSRYAYVKEDILRSKFGNWFADAMLRLRALFTDLKTRGMKEGITIIQPHETFKKWLDAQVALNANRTNKPKGKFALSKELSAEHRRIAEELLAAREAKKEAGRAEAEMPEEPAAPAGPGSLAELLKQAQGTEPKGKKKELKAAQPPADVVNTLPDDKELVLAELDRLYPLGAKATNVGDRTVYLSMLEKIRRGDLLTVLDHIQFVKGLDQAEDRQYSSKVLNRLPDQKKIKIATIELTLRQRDIKEVERIVYRELMQLYPAGVPREVIATYIKGKKVILTPTAYYQNRYPLAARLDADKFQTGPVSSTDVTLVWEAPFPMPERSHHFTDNDRYVMHSRHFDDGTIRVIVETQSDFFQRQRSERMKVGSDPSSQEILGTYSSAIEDIKSLHDEIQYWTKAKQADYAEEIARYPYLIDAAVRDSGITRADFLKYTQAEASHFLENKTKQLQEELRNIIEKTPDDQMGTQEEADYVSSLEKDWYKELVRLNVRLSMEQEKRWVLFRTAETVALLENWPFRFFLEGDRRDALQPVLEHFGKLSGHVGHNHGFYLVETRDSTGYTGYHQISVASPEGKLISLELPKHKLDLGKYQVMFNRYKNELEPYLKKDYAAEPFSGYNHEWLKVDLEQDQPEAYVAWDREVENPLETPNPEVVLTTFAGMTDEEARNPAKREEALAAWERSKFDSPYWKRFWGASKAVGNDGAPVKTWAGTGGRVLMLGPTEGFVLSENPATVSTPRSEGKQKNGPAKPYLQGFYASLQNPLEQDMAFAPYNEADVLLLMAQAIDAGHDGMILRNIKDPDVTTMYVPFSRAQIAMEDEIEPIDETDMMGWDAASDAQQTVRAFGKLLQNFGNRSWLRANHARQRTVDYLIQLQQVAAGQPEDRALQAFMFAKMEGERFKNQMQYVPNEVTKKMLNAFGSSKAAVEDLKKLLAAEQKTGVLASELVQVNGVWEVQDGIRLRELMVVAGLDPTSKRGQAVITHYLNVRNSFLLQFTGLQNALTANAQRRFSATPALLNRELLAIEDLSKKLREQPFVPQGHFGNYVVFVQQDQGPVKPGQRRFITVYKRHYESQADRDQAYLRMEKARGGDTTQRVGTRDLKDAGGLPIQLPSELLETINETGFFDDDQIKVLSELMVSTKYAKLGARYEKIGGSVKGANDDFVRTYAAFTWHNSNYIWKLQYGPALRAATAIARKNIKDLERDTMLTPEEKLARVTRQRRNLSLMENAVQYIMNPENELQALRYWITMAYLAYGLTTAAFNLSTQIHYWAALTTEYGELKGNLLYAQSLKDTTSLPFWAAMEKGTVLSQKERDRIGKLRWAYERAVYDGLLDQSYAYFLAGQANAGGVLDTTMTGWVGPTAHTALEAGMLPFRAVERGNRLSTFLGYFQAEKDRGVPDLWAYRHAAAKVDLLQGAYDPANRPMLMRGKKAILFMFASFTQMSQWTMWGGYERTARATARAQGREVPSLARSSTMKLWVIYMMLGGLMGLPGAQNLLDIAKWAWRKFFGDANIEVELRRFIQDMGRDPDAILHGALHDFMGFDLSGKFGLGRALPGTDLLNRNFQDPFTGLGQATVQMAGPAGGVAADGLRMLGKFQQGDIMGGVKEFPGVIGSMTKAWDAYLLQENTPTAGVTLKDGTRLTWDEKRGEFRDLTTKELLGMALGANPTILSKNRAEHFAMQGEKIYWETRRGDLTDKYWRALRTGDTELLEKVEGQIEKYNEVAPDVALMIRIKDLNTQVQGRRKAAHDAELHGLAGKHGKAIARDMQGLYRAESPEE